MPENDLDAIHKLVKRLGKGEVDVLIFMHKILVERDYKDMGFTINEKNIIETFLTRDISLDDIFKTVFKNNTQTANKKFSRFYLHPLITDWITRHAQIKPMDTILDGNVLVNSYLASAVKYVNPTNVHERITGLKSTCTDLLPLIATQHGPITTLPNDFLFTPDISKEMGKYNVIFYDIPTGMHNVTHASCCEQIKKLKIRGTSYEALTVQLITLLLADKGCAYITVPDSFLYRDTNQIVQTRQYLLDNFNVKAIFKLQTAFSDTKSSVIYVEAEGKTSQIEYSDLVISDDKVQKVDAMTICIKKIAARNYGLHLSTYKDLHLYEKTADEPDVLIAEHFDKSLTFPEAAGAEVLAVYKTDARFVSAPDANALWYYTLKPGVHPFLLVHLKDALRDTVNKENLTVLPYINPLKYNDISNLFLLKSKQKGLLIQVNQNFQALKRTIINMHTEFAPRVALEKVCVILDGETAGNTPVISILHNTSQSGKVDYHDAGGPALKSNWYLTCSDPAYDLKFLYYYLWFTEDKLKEVATMKTQKHVSKANVLSLGIPVLPLADQISIRDKCAFYDSYIANAEIFNDRLH